MGTTFLSSTGTQDHRQQEAGMARLLGPLLYRALLGLVCMTGEEGNRVAVGAAGSRGGGRVVAAGRGVSRACRAKTGRTSRLGSRVSPGGLKDHRTIVFLSPTNTPSYLASLVLLPTKSAALWAPPSRNLRF